MAAHEVRWRDDCVVVWVRRVVLILVEDVVSVGVERITEYLVARSAEGRRVAVEPHTRTDVVELTVEVEVAQYRERVRVDHEVDADSEVYASQKLVAQYDQVPVRIVRLVGRRSDKCAFDLLTVEKRADEILEARSAFANLHLGLCQYAWDRGHKGEENIAARMRRRVIKTSGLKHSCVYLYPTLNHEGRHKRFLRHLQGDALVIEAPRIEMQCLESRRPERSFGTSFSLIRDAARRPIAGDVMIP